MINKTTLKWFVTGFAVTSVVLATALVAVIPTIGLAQDNSEENPNIWSLLVEDEPPGAESADGPEGQAVQVPLVDNGAGRSNWEAAIPGDASSQADAGGPEGQAAPVPLVDKGAGRSNSEVVLPGDASPYIPEPDELGPEGAGSIGQYTSPLVVPGAAFTSDGFDPDGFFFSFSGGYVDGFDSACLKAPAYLPGNVTVSSFYASIYDNGPGDVGVSLMRVNRVSGATNLMASAFTTSDSTSIQNRSDSSIDYPEISYPDYAYYVTTCLDHTDHRLYSVRIYYTGP